MPNTATRKIKLIGPAGHNVVAEITGDRIIERKEGQLVHWRKNDDDPKCSGCGGHAAIWFDTDWRWERHPARCTAVIEAIMPATQQAA